MSGVTAQAVFLQKNLFRVPAATSLAHFVEGGHGSFLLLYRRSKASLPLSERHLPFDGGTEKKLLLCANKAQPRRLYREGAMAWQSKVYSTVTQGSQTSSVCLSWRGLTTFHDGSSSGHGCLGNAAEQGGWRVQAVNSDVEATEEGGTGRRKRVVHAVLREQTIGDGRIIIVGDIHGCSDEFVELLRKCEWQAKDSVVLVGDLGNKGPKSAEVVAMARQMGAHVVRGNHDDKVLSVLAATRGKGGNESRGTSWVKRLSASDISWMEGLPYSLSIPSHRAIVVHAGLIPGISLHQQRLFDMYTLRYIRPVHTNEVATKRGAGVWEACSEGEENSVLWGSVWQGPPHVFFGHDAARGLQLYKHATGLDTGCCYGGRLTACILPTLQEFGRSSRSLEDVDRPLGGRLVHVSAAGTYEPIKRKRQS